MSAAFIRKEKINGYLEISYANDGFITCLDTDTGQSIRMHHTVLKLMNRSVKINYGPNAQKRWKEQIVPTIVDKNIPDWVAHCAVIDCCDLLEFLDRYRMPESYAEKGPGHVREVRAAAQADIDKDGYTTLSRFESVTGRMITFIAPTREMSRS